MHDTGLLGCSYIGIDLGDRSSSYCALDSSGGKVAAGSFKTTPAGFRALLDGLSPKVVALEVGSHSPWASRLLEQLGHRVLVANPRQIPIIYGGTHKSDDLDAEHLARLARIDPQLLKPIRHRSEHSQLLLNLMRSREQLVKVRTSLINHVRGIAKSAGHRLESCAASSFHRRAFEQIQESLLPCVRPILLSLEAIHEQIRDCDRTIEGWTETELPATVVLRQVVGVGPLTAAAFILSLEDPKRFDNPRKVGAYLGLAPRRDQSGKRDRQCGITKAGNDFLRKLLIQAAHHILNRGPDCDLRRHGESISRRGGGHAYKRAITAVARKLSILLLTLWRTGEVYEPLRASRRRGGVDAQQAPLDVAAK
jgi:transposase